MTRPRRPVVHLVTLLFRGNTEKTGHGHQPHQGCDHQRPQARRSLGPSPTLCPQDGPPSTYPHRRGQRVGQPRKRQLGNIGRPHTPGPCLADTYPQDLLLRIVHLRSGQKDGRRRLRLTHFTDKIFLLHFSCTFPQRKPWWLLTLPPGCKRRLTSMLHSKRCPMDYQKQSTRNTPPPGTNGKNSASG